MPQHTLHCTPPEVHMNRANEEALQEVNSESSQGQLEVMWRPTALQTVQCTAGQSVMSRCQQALPQYPLRCTAPPAYLIHAKYSLCETGSGTVREARQSSKTYEDSQPCRECNAQQA